MAIVLIFLGFDDKVGIAISIKIEMEMEMEMEIKDFEPLCLACRSMSIDLED